MTRAEKLDELINLEIDLRYLQTKIIALRTELEFTVPKPKRLSSAGQALIDASTNGKAKPNPELDKRGRRKPKWTKARRKEYADRMRANQAEIQAGRSRTR